MQIVCCLVRAQYTLQPAIPTNGMLQKGQLWNLLVVNSSNNAVNCRLELTLRDRVTGLEQITATSSEFVLNKGARQFTNSLLAPTRYNNINTSFVGRGNEELLPIGNYVACYRLTTVGAKPVDLAEECTQFDIEPLSPPMLAFPADSAVLNIQPGQFTWIPPTPVQLFNHLSYEVMITEILPNQKAEEAIQQNLPFYMDLHAPFSLLNYNGTGGTFQKDKWYAWQVIAKDDRNYAAKSEVWTFKIKDSVIQQVPIPTSYAQLSNSLSDAATVAIKEGKALFMKYYSYEKEYLTKLKISRLNDTKAILEKETSIAYGDNFISMPLPSSIKKGETYQLTLTDSKGTSHYLLFRKEKQD